MKKTSEKEQWEGMDGFIREWEENIEKSKRRLAKLYQKNQKNGAEKMIIAEDKKGSTEGEVRRTLK